MSEELDKEIEIIEEEKKVSKKKSAPKKAKVNLCRVVGSGVSVYRTEKEREAIGGEWEILD